MFLYRYIYILLFPPFYMGIKKETISLKMNSQLWKDAKKKCIDKSIKYSDYVENLIKKDLGKK